MCVRALVAALLFGGCAVAVAQKAEKPDAVRWAAEARAITVVRDDWGIAHIHGKTDADAVFGMMYTQCEDDFNRVESNYLVALGRMAEAEGDTRLWADLRQQLFVDPVQLQKDYADSPAWMQKLMNAWADGANFYLLKHPDTRPRVLTHFEPWMALSFTEGSIGGDIERVDLRELEKHYGTTHSAGDAHNAAVAQLAQLDRDVEPGGSNGMAIAPSNTVGKHALLLINPHTSFFFRSELQMSSDEGLNAYGAVTWGQLFVYQGFNERAGWMHTSSNVDAIDEFRDTVVRAAGTVMGYKFGGETRPFKTRRIVLHFKGADGAMKDRAFDAVYDHRGPIVRDEGDAWVSVELMNTPVPALQQSFLRTKAHTWGEYRKTMELMANSSNNTIFADADGDIAYWHGNYIPERDTRFDYTKPVDGSNPATDWQGLMPLTQIPQLHNPRSGWIENVNNWPWSGSGESSLRRGDFPPYVEQGTETARGLHAVRVLEGRKDFTPDALLAAAFDPYLPWFARTLPVLVSAWNALPTTDPRKSALAEQVAVLRAWDNKWAADSIATSLAVYWGEAAGNPVARDARRAGALWEEYVVEHVTPDQMLTALAAASDKLTADFGTWKTPWGDINRFQRNDTAIVQTFDDAKPSKPVPFTGATWGSLASFAARTYPGTKKRYGTSGNSFVAVVEFGDKVRARAITAGGESGHPDSKHFRDEVDRYASGNFREVYFYPSQLKGHTERTYHPGE